MNSESKDLAPIDTAEHIERLKLDFVESTLSLVESFARQAARYAEQGDDQSALEAHSNFESFCQHAIDMIHKLQDRQSAEWFLARLRRVGCDPKNSRHVA